VHVLLWHTYHGTVNQQCCYAIPCYALQFGDQEGLRGMFVAMLELLKQRVGILRGVPVAQQGMGTANTSLVYHAGRLLALHEGDLPYQVRRCCRSAAIGPPPAASCMFQVDCRSLMQSGVPASVCRHLHQC
jgi:hypothetical protein